MILDEETAKVETISKIQPETSSSGDLFCWFGVETLCLNLCAEYVFWGREVIIVLWLSIESLGKDTFPKAIPFFQLVAQEKKKKKFSSLSLCPGWCESQKKLKVP